MCVCLVTKVIVPPLKTEVKTKIKQNKAGPVLGQTQVKLRLNFTLISWLAVAFCTDYVGM